MSYQPMRPLGSTPKSSVLFIYALLAGVPAVGLFIGAAGFVKLVGLPLAGLSLWLLVRAGVAEHRALEGAGTDKATGKATGKATDDDVA